MTGRAYKGSSDTGKRTRLADRDLALLIQEQTAEDIADAYGISVARVIDRLRRQGLDRDGQPIDYTPTVRRERVVQWDRDEDDWQHDAACRTSGYDPDMWFPDGVQERMTSGRMAKAVCGECPVRVKCLDAAMRAERADPRGGHGTAPLAAESRYGIYGGLDGTERARLARGDVA